MKKQFILAALTMLFPCFSMAQTLDSRALSYSVTYEKEHLFLQKDSGFNVVDYDIEWPEVIDFDAAAPVKEIISKSTTGTPTLGIDTLLNNINAVYGKPVSGPFKTIPDDDRFCYVTIKARIVGYEKGHWIAYQLEDLVQPQKKSEFQPHRASSVMVYDISRGRLYTANELLSSYVVQRSEPQDFYDYLFAPLSDDQFNDMSACQINGVWTVGDNLCFYVEATTDDQHINYVSSMPLADYVYVLSREGKKVFLKDAKARQPKTFMTTETWHGDSIYNNVEKMPVFKGGQEGLKQYLSHVGSPGIQLSKPVRVLLSYIVDKEGNVRDINVVSPALPELDRHAVSIVRGMPRYTPGEQDGNKVCVRMYMPINYK